MVNRLGYPTAPSALYPPATNGRWSSTGHRFAADGVETVNSSNFTARVLEAKQPVLVVFTDGGSQQDKRLDAALAELKRQPGADKVSIVQVNCRACPELAQAYGIQSLPTLKLFRPSQTPGQNNPNIINVASGESLEGVRPAAHITRYLATAARR